jgi:hypothetical protein
MSDNVIIPAARNLAHDPRPVANTRLNVGTGGTIVFVTDRSYSGTGSILATIPAGQSLNWHAAPDNDADLTALVGGTWRAMYHASGLSGPDIWHRIQILYTDGGATSGPLEPVVGGGLDFRRNTPLAQIADPTKTVSNVRVRLTNTGAVPRTVYLGGLDIRRNQELDSFIHGGGGTNYSWEGTVNASPSNRAAYTLTPVVGSGGQRYPSIRVHVVNRRNQILREVTDHFVDGSINYDLDAENWKGSCNIILDDPGLIVPFADEYFRVTLKIENPDGSFDEDSLGLFNVDAPTERWNSGSNDQWVYEGRDILSLLAQWTLPGTEDVEAGPGNLAATLIVDYDTAWNTAIRQLLVDRAEFDQVQYSFPGLTGTAQEVVWWEASASVLTMLTDILMAAGWQKPWVTPAGIITSAPAGIDPATITPAITLATGENSQVRWPFEVDPETSRVGNRVTVVSTGSVWVAQHTLIDPPAYTESYQQTVLESHEEEVRKKKQNKKKRGVETTTVEVWEEVVQNLERTIDPPPYWEGAWVTVHRQATAANEDPAHPLSFQRLGRWIDLPHISVPWLETNNACLQHGKQALFEAGNVPVRARLTTEVMVRGLNEVYELDLQDEYGNPIRSGQGRYWCRGWTLQLGSPWQMVHNLTRIVGFDVASGL